MNKLTLVSMAILCLLLTSCSKDLDDNTIIANPETAIDLREAGGEENSITVTYLNGTGLTAVANCASLAVSQAGSSASLTLSFADGSSQVATGTDIQMTSLGELTVTAGETTFESDDLFIDNCDNTLCYNDTAGINIGTATDFIIEDDMAGF